MDISLFQKGFSERFKKLRQDKGYKKQTAFVKEYDSRYKNKDKDKDESIAATIKKWERAASCPSIPILLNVCEMLDCSLDYILGKQDVVKNDNIDAHKRTGFDDIILENIAQLKADKEISNIASGNCTAYDVLCSLIGTETGIRLLSEIAYRITRISQYPKCEKVLTSDYAGRGQWLIPVEDLRRSDDMQLFYNILNWVNNHNTAQIYKSEFEELL